MSSIFQKIISGEIPSHKVAETDSCIAFLDINPLTTGHTLVVPKKEIDFLFDLPEADYAELMAFSRQVALVLRKVIPCKRIGVAVIGLEVPHAHIHLIPIQVMADMNFSNPKMKLTPEELRTTALKIKAAF